MKILNRQFSAGISAPKAFKTDNSLSRPDHGYRRRFLLLLCTLFLAAQSFSYADGAGDKIREKLKNVKRIVVVAPFFGTETQMKFAESKRNPKKSDVAESKKKIDPKLEQYVDYLEKIQSAFQKILPERISARTPFKIVPDDEVKERLEATKLTPRKLFIDSGLLQRKKAPVEDMLNMSRFLETLHADAILLTVLDEPRRNLEHYYFDPLSGLNVRPSHVQCRAFFLLLLADGNTVLSKFVDVSHPISKIGKRDFLLADWQETEELAIENYLDELTLYTPEKKRGERIRADD